MKAYLTDHLTAALRSLELPTDVIPLELPKLAAHGDLATTVALALAKARRENPRALAEKLVKALGHTVDPEIVTRMEIAGPGFINFTFGPKLFQQRLGEILTSGDGFGRQSAGSGEKVQVEFVSANPTGPLTVGHGRGAVIGDTVANLLTWAGHDVTREYYFNNAGRQMRVLGDSVRLRALQVRGAEFEFPEGYYQGEYITDIARDLLDTTPDPDSLFTDPASTRPEPVSFERWDEGLGFLEPFKEIAERTIFADIQRTLSRLGIGHDVYFNEDDLYRSGDIEEVIATLRAKDLAYDKDGAVFFRLTELGRDEDKVLVKRTGEPTYRLPDIAYHRNKLRRGFTRVIDVLGSDHVATFPDVMAGLGAMGYDPSAVRLLMNQFVTITRDGEIVKMSTRRANYVTLDELIDEVGGDVVRFFFLMRSSSTQMNFDLGLAKQEGEENPVFYLQYAHARVASVERMAAERGVAIRTDPGQIDFSLLVQPTELSLIKTLTEFAETVVSCAESMEPHRLIVYLNSVATHFHGFYHHCDILPRREEQPVSPELTQARLALARGAKAVLANGFAILGISAPDRM